MSTEKETDLPGASQSYITSKQSVYSSAECSTDLDDFLNATGASQKQKESHVQLAQIKYPQPSLKAPAFSEGCAVDTTLSANVFCSDESDDDTHAAAGLHYESPDKKHNSTKLKLDMADMRTKNLEDLLDHLKLEHQAKKVNQDYKEKLKAANLTILKLECQLQEVEKKKYHELTICKREMQNKLEEYERELENSYKKIKTLEDQIKVKGGLEEIKMLQEKLLLSEMTNDRQQNEIGALRSQLSEKTQTGNAASLQINLNNALMDQKNIAAELETRDAQLAMTKVKLEYLEQLLKDNLANLNTRGNIQEVLNRGQKTKVELWNAKHKIAKLEKQLQMVQEHLDATVKRHSDPDELAHIRKQLSEYKLVLNDTMQKKASVEAQLATANREIERLSNELKSRRSEDELFVLQSQLGMFRADFEEEHRYLMEERNRTKKLSEELQQIERNNQLLQEELELLKREGEKELPRLRSSARNNSQVSKQNQTFYKCPKCTFQFDDLEKAEVHINQCLDLDDSLP